MVGSGSLDVPTFIIGYVICYVVAGYCASRDSLPKLIKADPDDCVGEFLELSADVAIWVGGNLEESISTHVSERCKVECKATLAGIINSRDAQEMEGFISALAGGIQQPLCAQPVQGLVEQIGGVARTLRDIQQYAEYEIPNTVNKVLRAVLGGSFKWDATVTVQARLGQKARQVVESAASAIISRLPVVDELTRDVLKDAVHAVLDGNADYESLHGVRQLIDGINRESHWPGNADRNSITAEPLLDNEEEQDNGFPFHS